jgi:hypothetical protein
MDFSRRILVVVMVLMIKEGQLGSLRLKKRENCEGRESIKGSGKRRRRRETDGHELYTR